MLLLCYHALNQQERRNEKKEKKMKMEERGVTTHHRQAHTIKFNIFSTNNYNNNNKKKCVFFNSICTFLLVFCSHKPSTSRKEISKRLKEIKENIKYTPEQIGCIIFFIQTETIIHRLHNSSRHLQIWRLVRCGSVNSELYRSHLRENVLAETCPSLCKR